MSPCCQRQQQQSTLRPGIPSGLVSQTYQRSSLGQVRSILVNCTATGRVSLAEWYPSCLDLHLVIISCLSIRHLNCSQ